MSTASKLSKTEIRNELWRRGQLKWLLDEGEKILYELYYNTDHKKQVWVLGRRSGKTYTLVTLALEQCIRQPNSIVKIVSPTKTQCNLNLRPIFTKLLSSCPEDIKPELRQQEFIYYFPNGSEIQMAGTDNGHAEKLRGGDAHIVMIDEAGSCKDLKNIVNSVLLPTTLITRGKIVLATTPPKELDHEFNEFWEEAELRGSLVLRTFKENPRLTPEMIAEMTEELGGENSESFRREMLCQRIKDSSRSVIPEATPELFAEIVKDWEKPPYFDCYEGMDLGLNDLTVVLFGYFDFKNDKVVIEQEIIKQGKDLHLDKLGQEIIATEEALWMNPITHEVRVPYFRVSDHNLVAINEIRLATFGKVNFIPARKDDKESAINHLRMLLAAKKIIIHPRCTTLIRHLQNVKWASDTNRKTYGRSPDDGHYDACFTAGNKVLTSSGYKNIEDVVVGDEVLTHLNRFKPVTNIMSKQYEGNLVKIKADGREEIVCTPDHSFYVGEFERNVKDGFTGQAKLSNVTWKSAKTLDKNNKLYIPNQSNFNNFKSSIVSDFSGLVYNLEIQDDNSYTVNDVAVHNCDALIYMIRSIVWSKNPYPAHYNLETRDLYVTNVTKFNSNDNLNVYRQIFGKGRKKD